MTKDGVPKVAPARRVSKPLCNRDRRYWSVGGNGRRCDKCGHAVGAHQVKPKPDPVPIEQVRAGGNPGIGKGANMQSIARSKANPSR